MRFLVFLNLGIRELHVLIAVSSKQRLMIPGMKYIGKADNLNMKRNNCLQIQQQYWADLQTFNTLRLFWKIHFYQIFWEASGKVILLQLLQKLNNFSKRKENNHP